MSIFFETLHNLPIFEQSKIVMCYVSTHKEADTHTLINEMLFCGKKVAVPKSYDDFSMDFYFISSLSELIDGKFGIKEPRCDINNLFTIDKSQPDITKQLIIVPGVEFDIKKNRKGHGCGYYDRYFHRYGKDNFYKIGLAREAQIKEAIEVKPHDVPMDLIIAESGRII